MRFHTDANLAIIRDGDRGDGFDCIPPTRYRRPRFVFSPSDLETSAALRQKIESKMKTAGILGDFLTGLFTFAAKDIGAALFDHHRTYAAGHRDCSVLHHAVLLRPTPDANEFWRSRPPKTTSARAVTLSGRRDPTSGCSMRGCCGSETPAMSSLSAEVISGQLRAGCECGQSSGVVNHFAPLIAGRIDDPAAASKDGRTDKAEYLLPHFQLIAHLGACGKTRVMPQNCWPKPELTESGVAKCVSCWRRMSRAERSNRYPAMRWWLPEEARQG